MHEEAAQTGQTAVSCDKSLLPRKPVRTGCVALAMCNRSLTDPTLPQAPALEDDTDLHFVTFVEHKGFLIELDGRRNSPINHGKIEKGLLDVRCPLTLIKLCCSRC